MEFHEVGPGEMPEGLRAMIGMMIPTPGGGERDGFRAPELGLPVRLDGGLMGLTLRQHEISAMSLAGAMAAAHLLGTELRPTVLLYGEAARACATGDLDAMHAGVLAIMADKDERDGEPLTGSERSSAYAAEVELVHAFAELIRGGEHGGGAPDTLDDLLGRDAGAVMGGEQAVGRCDTCGVSTGDAALVGTPCRLTRLDLSLCPGTIQQVGAAPA